MGQALRQVPKLLQGMKRPQSLPFREPIFSFGFIHVSPTAPNRVENYTFKNVSLILQPLKMTIFEKPIIM